MARKPARKRAASSSAAEPKVETATVRIVAEPTAETPTYYINHVEMAAGPHEFAMWFTRLPTKPSRIETQMAIESGELRVDPEFQILLPPSIMPGFATALEKVRAGYEKEHGPIRTSDDDAGN